MPINYDVDYPKLQKRCWDAELERDKLAAELAEARELLREARNSYGYTEDQWAGWREKADAALAKERI